MAAENSIPWSPIEDLPVHWESLGRSELRALGRVWDEQKSRLVATGELDLFNRKLVRELAIETGILERLYSLDRGITVLLIEQGIDASLISRESTDKDPELVAAVIRDQHEAARALFDFVAQGRALSTAYVKELHALLTRNQATTTALTPDGRRIEVELLRGDWKRRPNNPRRADGTVHEYCPPEQVASEMDRLLALHHEHHDHGVPPEVEAAWLHHRFTQIHPFQDGNGRVARLLSSLVFLRAGWFPLVIDRDQRLPYITALESADRGDLSPLIELLASREKSALIRALSLVRETDRQVQVSQVIQAARRELEQRRERIKSGWETVRTTAGAVHSEAEARLETVRHQLADEVGPLRRDFRFSIDEESSEGDRRHWFRYQVVETAKKLQYFANTDQFHAWVRLVLETEIKSEILISIHGLGKEYAGLLAVSACFFQKATAEEAGHVSYLVPLSDEVFQLNYLEPQEQALARFRDWLDDSLVRGLEVWRKGL